MSCRDNRVGERDGGRSACDWICIFRGKHVSFLFLHLCVSFLRSKLGKGLFLSLLPVSFWSEFLFCLSFPFLCRGLIRSLINGVHLHLLHSSRSPPFRPSEPLASLWSLTLSDQWYIARKCTCWTSSRAIALRSSL